MHSRVVLLLHKQINELKNNPPWGVQIHTDDEVPLELFAVIRGLKNSIWDGGIFRLQIRFSENFNNEPPDIQFQTIPFHPNIDPNSGRPCASLLYDSKEWPRMTLCGILVFLQILLCEPCLEDAVNTQAVEMLENDLDSFEEIAMDCVFASQQLAADAANIGASIVKSCAEASVKILEPVKIEPAKPIALVSFIDYHARWKEMATSKLDSSIRSKHAGHGSDIPVAQNRRKGKKRLSESKEQINRKARIEKMRRLYLREPTQNNPSPVGQPGHISLSPRAKLDSSAASPPPPVVKSDDGSLITGSAMRLSAKSPAAHRVIDESGSRQPTMTSLGVDTKSSPSPMATPIEVLRITRTNSRPLSMAVPTSPTKAEARREATDDLLGWADGLNPDDL